METSWQEPDEAAAGIDPKRRLVLIGASSGVAVVLGIVAFFSGEPTLYLGIVVVFAALAAVLAQSKRGRLGRIIQLDTHTLSVDEKTYPVSDLAGFWFYDDESGPLVIIEYKKPALIPLTLFADTADWNAMRARLTPLLPELEPRQNHLDSGILSRFRF